MRLLRVVLRPFEHGKRTGSSRTASPIHENHTVMTLRVETKSSIHLLFPSSVSEVLHIVVLYLGVLLIAFSSSGTSPKDRPPSLRRTAALFDISTSQQDYEGFFLQSC